ADRPGAAAHGARGLSGAGPGTPTAAGARGTVRRRGGWGPRGARGDRAASGLGGDGRGLQGDADLVAGEGGGGLQRGAAGEAALLAGVLGRGRGADAGVAERVGGRTVVLRLEGGGLGHTVDGEVAVHGDLRAGALDAAADEGPCRLVR